MCESCKAQIMSLLNGRRRAKVVLIGAIFEGGVVAELVGNKVLRVAELESLIQCRNIDFCWFC